MFGKIVVLFFTIIPFIVFGDNIESELKRIYYLDGVAQYTNCPYMARLPNGILLTMEECVAERSPEWPHQVTRWRDFAVWDEFENKYNDIQLSWDSPFYEKKYDAAPHRCKESGFCVPTPKDCYKIEKIKNLR